MKGRYGNSIKKNIDNFIYLEGKVLLIYIQESNNGLDVIFLKTDKRYINIFLLET